MGHPRLRAGTAWPDCCWAVLGPEVQPIGRHSTTRCVGRAGPTDFVPSTAVPSRAARLPSILAMYGRWRPTVTGGGGADSYRAASGGGQLRRQARGAGRAVRGGGARTCGGAPMPWQGAARGRRGRRHAHVSAAWTPGTWVRSGGVSGAPAFGGGGSSGRGHAAEGHGAAAASRRDAVARRLHAR